jgi:hypothetical protein
MLDDARQRRRQAAKAARDRRLRARRKACRIVVPVEVDGDVLTLLVQTGWLVEADAASREKIGEAITAALAASARV